MSPLPAPIKDRLRDPVDDLLPQRVWRRMALEEKRRARPRLPIGLVAAAAFVLMIAFLILRPGREEPAELRLAGGAVPDVLAVQKDTGPEAFDFADGTRVIL